MYPDCVPEGPIGLARGERGKVRLRHRPAQVRRLPCLRGGLQDGERRSPTSLPDPGSRCASSETSPDAAEIGPRGAAGREELRKTKPCPRTLCCGPLPGAPTPRKVRRQSRSDAEKRPQRLCRSDTYTFEYSYIWGGINAVGVATSVSGARAAGWLLVGMQFSLLAVLVLAPSGDAWRVPKSLQTTGTLLRWGERWQS